MKVAVVGATGLVGREMIKVMEEKRFPVEQFIPVATERSIGRKVMYSGNVYQVMTTEDALSHKPDLALFSAGSTISKKLAPRFTEAGTTVIDNSSAWRMDEKIPLVVPEINGNILTAGDKLIANPNCSTIQLVMALFPLHNKYGIKRVVVSTYQSVSGSGAKGVNQLMAERKGEPADQFYPHRIDLNALPHAGDFEENGYTTEENKLVKETHKIMSVDFGVTATAVRIPVIGGHSESVNIEFESEFEVFEVKRLLGVMPGVVVIDMPEGSIYPMPLLAHGKNEVFVGRIRRDPTRKYALNLWIVADNLRKGAATNAVQIAEYLFKKGLINT
ncbi:MAG: aspartate-semialdehyde dehydrogenase [bacterium]